MVQIFQPDEAAPLPYIFRMIAPAPTLNLALRHFIFYDFYYYGFPFFASSALLLTAPAMAEPLGRYAAGHVGAAPGHQRATHAGSAVAAGVHARRIPHIPFAGVICLSSVHPGRGGEQFLVPPGWDHIPVGGFDHLLS